MQTALQKSRSGALAGWDARPKAGTRACHLSDIRKRLSALILDELEFLAKIHNKVKG